MKRPVLVLIPLGIVVLLLLQVACQTTDKGSGAPKFAQWEKQMGAVVDTPMSADEIHQQLNMKVDLIPKGKFGRRLDRPMKPTFITIHSTQNPTGDAHAHARALNRGALCGGVCGYLCWHFTVQGDTVIQHIPTNERGEHADFDGPGNRQSIGIEMCEHAGNDMLATMERTAKLAATLMYHHDIPIENIRAHYHWPREGYPTPNKNCPHFLMENGKPGATWRWFVGRINRHHQRIVKFEEARKQQQEQQQQLRNTVWRWVQKAGSRVHS